jgi:hypothetical protein
LKGDIIKVWWTEVAPSTGPIFSGHQEVSSGMSITYLLGIESNLPLNTSVQPHSYSRPVDKYLQLSPIEPTIPRWLQPCCYCVFEELTVVFALRITTAADELIKCEAYEDSRKADTTFSINICFSRGPSLPSHRHSNLRILPNWPQF